MWTAREARARAAARRLGAHGPVLDDHEGRASGVAVRRLTATIVINFHGRFRPRNCDLPSLCGYLSPRVDREVELFIAARESVKKNKTPLLTTRVGKGGSRQTRQRWQRGAAPPLLPRGNDTRGITTRCDAKPTQIALFSARAIASARLVRASASLQLGIPTRRLQRRHLDRGVVAYHGAVAGATAPLPAPC